MQNPEEIVELIGGFDFTELELEEIYLLLALAVVPTHLKATELTFDEPDIQDGQVIKTKTADDINTTNNLREALGELDQFHSPLSASSSPLTSQQIDQPMWVISGEVAEIEAPIIFDDFIFAHTVDLSSYNFAYTVPTLLAATITGTNGVDNPLDGDMSDNSIAGLGGDDRITAQAGDDAIDAGSGDDTVFGEDGNDTILGGQGEDTIFGGDHNDTIFGQDDNDDPIPGDGNDVVNGGAGEDSITGDEGNDVLIGEGGIDNISGDNGDDVIFGNDGNDILRGNNGNDNIIGGSGNDRIFGGNNNDVISGGDNDDEIYGQNNDDLISGGSGTDLLFGGNGDDVIGGGTGNDHLFGGGGVDELYGEEGRDHYYFDATSFDGNVDIIKQFTQADNEKVIILDHVLSGYVYGVSDNSDYIDFVIEGNNTAVYVDRDGLAAGFTAERIAVIEQITTISEADFLVSASIVV